MATTIQVTEHTLELLKQLRKTMNASSYNEVINRVIEKSMKSNKSLYGAIGRRGINWIMKGLRDKDDKF